MSFRATCTHPEHMNPGRTDKDRKRAYDHLEAHGFPSNQATKQDRTITFTDPAEYEAHCKLTGRTRISGMNSGLARIRPWKPPTRKPFDPQLGEVGSWVWFYDNDVRGNAYLVTGQVWSVITGGSRPRVWVADGTTWHDVAVSDLAPAADPARQSELIA